MSQNLQSLYNFTPTDQPNVLEIRTETVNPLTTSATKAIFRLEPQGYLDENSMLLFKLAKSATAAGELRVNSFNGALGAVRRATLSVGDWILNDTDRVDKWATLHHLMTKNRSVYNGVDSHYLGNQFKTKPNPSKLRNGADDYDNVNGELIPDSANCGVSLGKENDGTVAGYEGYIAAINSHQLDTNAANNFEYGIRLGYLFPCLQGRQLPLFLFDQYRIRITIEWNPTSVFCNNIIRTNYAGAQYLNADEGQVTISNPLLLIDYLLYPAVVQETLRNDLNKEGGYTIDFYDVVRIVKNLEGGLDRVKQTQEFSMGQANREVHRIYMLRQQALSGRRSTLLLDYQCDGMNIESVNWNINGVDEFVESLENPAWDYDNLAMALNTYPSVERPMYFSDETTEFCVLAKDTNPLHSTYKPLGLDLRNGQPGIVGGGRLIGNYPIVCRYTRTPHAPDDAINHRDTRLAQNIDFFVMCSRRATITSGMKGNDVRVSY